MLNQKKYHVLSIDENSNSFHLTEVVVDKKGVHQKSGKAFKDKAEMLKKAPKYSSLMLHIHGKEVFSKVVDSFQDNLIKQVLPSASTKEFFWQQYESSSAKIIAIVRKQYLLEWLETLRANGFRVYEVALGNATLELIPKQAIDNVKAVGGIQFFYGDKGQLQKMEVGAEQKSITFGGATYNYWEALGLSIVQSSLTGTTETLQLPEMKWHQKEVTNAKRFKNVGLAVILFFFTILLLNYFYLQQLLAENVEKEGQLMFYKDEVRAIEDLENQLENKKTLLQKSGVTNTNFLSYYIYDIFPEMKESIEIRSCEVRPVTDKIKKNEPINFDQNTMIIAGKTASEMMLKTWLSDIKKKEWVKKVSLLDYQLDKDDLGEFTLEVEL